jgi:hypothetical protein
MVGMGSDSVGVGSVGETAVGSSVVPEQAVNKNNNKTRSKLKYFFKAASSAN